MPESKSCTPLSKSSSPSVVGLGTTHLPDTIHRDPQDRDQKLKSIVNFSFFVCMFVCFLTSKLKTAETQSSHIHPTG